MNKRKVDKLLPLAKQAIIDYKISEDGVKINPAFRGQISSFGAAIANGSLLAAVAFFSQQKGASVDRSKLMTAINQMLDSQKKDLFEYINTAKTPMEKRKMKENVLNCAIALKLAMNLFDLKEETAK